MPETSTPPDHTATPESGRPARQLLPGLVLGLTALLTLLLVAFSWPSSELGPRNVPVAVVGPAELSAQVDQALDQALGDDAVEVVPAASREQALSLIEEREVYGALVPTGQGVEVLIASAGGPAVAQLVTEIGNRLAPSVAPTVTDVVPLPAGDPRGVVFGSAAFPLVIGGIATAALLALRLPGRGARLVGVAGVAVGAGLALTAVLQLWLDALAGSYWANAGVVALGLGAIALALLGLHHVLGEIGLGLGAATIILLGNPLSGVTTAPELLPDGWSTLGQLLPPGAAGTALRSVAFFEGNGGFLPLLVLTGWALLGLLLLALPARRQNLSSD